jgi:hypothetical protein
MNFEEAVAVPMEFTLDANVIAVAWRMIDMLPNAPDDFGANVTGPRQQLILRIAVKVLQDYVDSTQPVPRSSRLIDRANRPHAEVVSFPSIDPDAFAELSCDQSANFVETAQLFVSG